MFQKAIKEALKNKERDQAWLARHVGVDKSNLSTYLAGKGGLGNKKVMEIFEFLGIGLKVPRG